MADPADCTTMETADGSTILIHGDWLDDGHTVARWPIFAQQPSIADLHRLATEHECSDPEVIMPRAFERTRARLGLEGGSGASDS